MIKFLSGSALVCALLLSGSLAQAFPGDQVQNGRSSQYWGQQLSPQQKQQAEKIFKENYESMNSTREALIAKRQQLNEELNSSSPDTAKIENLSREIGELRGKMLAARIEVRSRLAEEGLPEDFYGPNVPARKPQNRGPEVWHGSPADPHHGGPRGWHHRGWNYRGYGCPGMMGW